MRLVLRLDRTRARAWQVDLLRRLSARAETEVVVEHAAAVAPLPRMAERLFRLERALSPRTAAAAAAPATVEAAAADDGAPANLVIDLTGSAAPSPVRTWRVFYDGEPGEAGLFSALIESRNPVAALCEGDRTVASGRLGTETPGNIRAAFADALARTGTLIEAALDSAPAAAPMPVPSVGGQRDFGVAALAAMAARRVAATAARRLHRLNHHDFHWRVGWRRLDGPDLYDLRRHPSGGWHDLPDDGRRFYADPFPIEVAGAVTLFMEEYPQATGRGVISAVTFDAHGPVGRPEPVLELPYHLSYPFVFARDGAVWMVPESCAAGSIDLFRATAFPGGWVKERTLVGGVEASDATLVERDGRWWMFATVKTGASYSDALHLWSAPDFRGPWKPHRHNPVLIDSASARPAGRMVERDGVLWRPVQDCRREYGGALGLARVTRLDDAGFAQDVATILEAGRTWPGTRLHTVNRAGAFEFIDGSGEGRKPLFG